MADYYNIYRGRDGVIDYETPVATMTLADTEVEIEDQDLPPNSIWHYVRRQVRDDCGLESEDSPVCIVYIDELGDMRSAAPNPPTDLIAELAAGGKVRLRWRYSSVGAECSPDGFAIFQSTDGVFSETPTALVAGGISPGNEFLWLSDALSEGYLYRFIIKSYSNITGGISQPSAVVIAAPGSTGPPAIANLIAEADA
ncbi:MAG: hypothetical protein WC551_11050 [Patescibacteria group bacterium]